MNDKIGKQISGSLGKSITCWKVCKIWEAGKAVEDCDTKQIRQQNKIELSNNQKKKKQWSDNINYH